MTQWLTKVNIYSDRGKYALYKYLRLIIAVLS